MNHIQVEATRPICWDELDQFEILQKLSKKYGKTPIQIVLSWHIDKGIQSLPKTIHKIRMIENLNIFDFKLSKDEIIGIDKLNTGIRQTG